MLIWAKGYTRTTVRRERGRHLCTRLPRGDSRIAIGGDTRLLFEVETPSLSPSPTKLIRGDLLRFISISMLSIHHNKLSEEDDHVSLLIRQGCEQLNAV